MPNEASVDQLGIREIPLPESVTGIVALVIRPDLPTIRAAYELADALALADGLLDPVANAAVVEATRRAFGGDRELVANAERYGYSLVRQRYLPHITLGFDSRPIDAPAARPAVATRAHTMAIDRVVVAPLGAYGRIDAVYSPD